MVHCCVPNCSTSPTITLHMFPKYLCDAGHYEAWITAIGRHDLKKLSKKFVLSYYRVCDTHFSSDQKIASQDSQVCLKHDAIPNCNLPSDKKDATVVQGDTQDFMQLSEMSADQDPTIHTPKPSADHEYVNEAESLGVDRQAIDKPATTSSASTIVATQPRNYTHQRPIRTPLRQQFADVVKKMKATAQDFKRRNVPFHKQIKHIQRYADILQDIEFRVKQNKLLQRYSVCKSKTKRRVNSSQKK